MRKLAIAFAALAAFGIATPLTSSAKAEDTVIIKKDGDHGSSQETATCTVITRKL